MWELLDLEIFLIRILGEAIYSKIVNLAHVSLGDTLQVNETAKDGVNNKKC